MKEQLARFDKPEGVVFIGKAQEKTPVFRTEKRRNPQTGSTYPWIVRSSAMVNHFNGLVSCDGHDRLQTICDQPGPEQIDALPRRWLAKLPLPSRHRTGKPVTDTTCRSCRPSSR